MPNRTDPTGRITKPTPNTAKVDSNDTTGSPLGKNNCDIVGTRYPYTPKSYHSRTLPMTPAVIALRYCVPVPAARSAAATVMYAPPGISVLTGADMRDCLDLHFERR